MESIKFTKINEDDAREIAAWQYEPFYKMYSMDGSNELIEDLLKGNYYSARNKDNEELIGYICYGYDARIPGGYDVGLYDDPTIEDIGLGLKPELTGKGNGLLLLTEALTFLKNLKDPQPLMFQLVVATFNLRAIKVYEKVGFKTKRFFISHHDNGIPYDFQAMRHTCSHPIK